MEDQEFLCPSPTCRMVFDSLDEICSHLRNPSDDCSQWATEYLNCMMQRNDVGNDDDELDDEPPDNHGTISQLNLKDKILTCNLDDDDPPPLPPLHSQVGEPSPPDAWSPPAPESLPFDAGLSQTVPPVYLQPTAGDTPTVALTGLHKEFHPKPSLYRPGGKNLLQRIDEDDEFAAYRASQSDIHYPFASRSEWQLAKWLASASLSRAEIDRYLHLDYVSHHSIN
jgi:hypothetical protein